MVGQGTEEIKMKDSDVAALADKIASNDAADQIEAQVRKEKEARRKTLVKITKANKSRDNSME